MATEQVNRDGISPVAVINIVLFSVAFNIFIMAISFAILAGVAHFQNLPNLAQLFGMATGFLVLLGTVVGVIQGGLVNLIEDLAF